MSYQLAEYLSYLSVIPALLAWLRWPNMDRRFLPFVLFLTAGLLTEIISQITIKLYRTNAVPSHMYALVEALLIVWQFKCWGLFERHKKVYPVLLSIVVIVWSFDNIIRGRIATFDTYYAVILSFMIVLLSVQQVNKEVAQERSGILKNAIFQICIAFIIFFTYDTLVEIFYIYGLTINESFNNSLYDIMVYANILINILFTVAVLWIPRKQKSLLQ
jgi:hypothetical protein